MAHKIFIGIDNGTSGTIGWMGDGIETGFAETPKFEEQSYTKAAKNISRIKRSALRELILKILGDNQPCEAIAVLERPRVNPKQFVTTLSAMRALEATLCVLEDLGVPLTYTDSRPWQKKMLPQGIKGSAELKKASKEIGCRLYPQFADAIRKHKDADGLLIAEWASRERL